MKNGRTKIIAGIAVVILLFLIFYPAPTEPKGNFAETVAGPFENINLEARAAVVFDLVKDESVFELNSNVQLPLASLAKIMTVLVAGEIIPAEKMENLSKTINLALVQSSNEAAVELAVEASKFLSKETFLERMNRKAGEFSLNQTFFLNETGLDISPETSGAYGSASDVIELMKRALAYNPDLFEATTNPVDGEAINTNTYATSTTLLIASKTGLTDLAGGNLAIIFDAGFSRPMAIVVLGSSKEGRFSDVQKLIKATFNYLATNN